MTSNAIRIHPKDTVAVALAQIAKGGNTMGLDQEVRAAEDIPQGHKLAIVPIRAGEAVIKYGCPIGIATRDICPGEHVHTHSLRTGLSDQLQYAYRPAVHALKAEAPVRFEGFVRENGSVGIRNDIWIVPTVGCVNGIAQRLAQIAQRDVRGSVGRVIALPHPYGCSQMGEDQEATCTILADLCAHPNAGGVLLLGLGCENSGVADIMARIPEDARGRVETLVCQRSDDEIADGLSILGALIARAANDRRERATTASLVVGLKCGGSDGLSGITANPVIGGFSDRLIARGGTTLLTEVPEMFGAESLLMARCQDEATFERTVALINGFKRYYQDHGQPIYENPSPGNKQGGISTLEDKALGCTQKSGSAPVRGVLAYGERVDAHGLNLLSAPGNDLVASTALAAAGAQIVLFSTGRGTPFGSPVPTVKISSNTELAERKRAWIDFDAGRALAGMTIDALSDALLRYVLEVASGRPVRHEEAGIFDMAIFKRGVTL